MGSNKHHPSPARLQKLKPLNTSNHFQQPQAKHGSPIDSPVESFLNNSTADLSLDALNYTKESMSPTNKTNNTFIHDDSRSETSNISTAVSRRGSITGVNTPGDGQGMVFISKLHSHYGLFVKMMPILIIFLPSVLKLFFPGVIKFGEFQFGDDKNHPSAIVVDIFSILLICWILKFLLDWPWKWYLQISDLELKLKMYLETVGNGDNHGAQRPATPSPIGKTQDITQMGLQKLEQQHWVALIFCVLAPFFCGGILALARRHIILIGTGGDVEGNAIFSDLNIGIFVSCGLIRVIIQISEQIQKSTASIESKTEKLIQVQAQESLQAELSNRLTAIEPECNTDVASTEEFMKLQSQVDILQNEFKLMNSRFQLFYNKNKLAIDNDLSFLSAKHFKVLEKEINELNTKLHNKTFELEQLVMNVIRTTTTVQSVSSNDENRRPDSLHGIPLGKNTPTYIIDPNGTPVKYPIQRYSQSIGNNLSSLSKMKELFPMLDNYGKSERPEEQFDEEALKQLETLHEGGYLKIDLSLALPLVKFILSLPFLTQRAFWKVISYIPSQVSKAVYFMLLQALDALVEIYHQNQKEMKAQTTVATARAVSSDIDIVTPVRTGSPRKFEELEGIQEVSDEEEASMVKSPKKRRYAKA